MHRATSTGASDGAAQAAWSSSSAKALEEAVEGSQRLAQAGDADVMFVQKRDGSMQELSLEKITQRFRQLSNGQCGQCRKAELSIRGDHIATTLCSHICNGISTTRLDLQAADLCIGQIFTHADFAVLAARLLMSNLHKSTASTYLERVTLQNDLGLLASDAFAFMREHAAAIQEALCEARDYDFDYFGIKTLERSYLLKKQMAKRNGHTTREQVVERPQDMFVRVAVQLYRACGIEDVLRCYRSLSERRYIHATPTLFNSCAPMPQLSSCYLLAMDDSIDDIYDVLKECALISKGAGGIGLDVTQIRCKGSLISGTNGTANGLVPMLRMYNNSARYVDQGGGKRKGGIAAQLRDFHADIFDFLLLRNNQGDENARARDLFYAVLLSDLFMRRAIDDGQWTLFCPKDAPDLVRLHGKDFEKAYVAYEAAGVGRRTIQARELWKAIITSMMENGTPYVLFHDSMNAKSNQKNLGTIRSSNLCTEIVQYTSTEETAVCNLASINLSSMFVPATPQSAFGNGRDGERLSVVTLVVRAGSPGCEYCDLSKMLLDRLGMPYSCVEMATHPARLPIDDATWVQTQREHGARRMYQDHKELRLGGRGNFHNLQVLDLTTAVSLCDERLGLAKSNDADQQAAAVASGRRLSADALYAVRYLCMWAVDNDLVLTEAVKVLNRVRGFTSVGQFRHATVDTLHDALRQPQSVLASTSSWYGAAEPTPPCPCPQAALAGLNELYTWMLRKGGAQWGLAEALALWKKTRAQAATGAASVAEDAFVPSDDSDMALALLENGSFDGMLAAAVCNGEVDFLAMHRGGQLIMDGHADSLFEEVYAKRYGTRGMVSEGIHTFPLVFVDGSHIGGYTELLARVRGSVAYDRVESASRELVRNLNRVIDVTTYPDTKTRRSNLRHRPMGIGVQGLADLLHLLRIPFQSSDACEINRRVFASIYFGAVSESCAIARERHETFHRLLSSGADEAAAARELNLHPDVVPQHRQLMACIDQHRIDTIRRKCVEEVSATLKTYDAVVGGDAAATSATSATSSSPRETETLARALGIPLAPSASPTSPPPKYPGAYSSFEGSPLSKGQFQFDLWDNEGGGEWHDWESLRADVLTYGVMNSLLLAPMPTASTAQIMGNNECFEPYTTNAYNRRVLSGEFVVINKHCIRDLRELSRWDKKMKDRLIANEGSLTGVEGVPKALAELYLPVWEMKQRVIIDMAHARGRYICQSQSMNLFMAQPEYTKISSMLKYAWQRGLKTGCYYLRSKPRANAQRFTVDPGTESETRRASSNAAAESDADANECVMCGA